jgi:AraC-like DNA-binding protein
MSALAFTAGFVRQARHGPMYRQLTEQAEKYLKSLNTGDNIAAQLKRGLADLLAQGEANADAACRVLKISRRTLQRRLKAEKTSFQKILNEVRAELAVRYLSDRRLKALEVAMLLGYSSISSFTTAFKSWYDMPPIEYRQKILRFG